MKNFLNADCTGRLTNTSGQGGLELKRRQAVLQRQHSITLSSRLVQDWHQQHSSVWSIKDACKELRALDLSLSPICNHPHLASPARSPLEIQQSPKTQTTPPVDLTGLTVLLDGFCHIQQRDSYQIQCRTDYPCHLTEVGIYNTDFIKLTVCAESRFGHMHWA